MIHRVRHQNQLRNRLPVVAEVVVMEVVEAVEGVVVLRLLTTDVRTRGKQSARAHVVNGWLEKAASVGRLIEQICR
jgi:hypothetical protein